MEKLCLSVLFLTLISYLFSQENYEKDEWNDVAENYFASPFYEMEVNEEAITDEVLHTPSSPVSYLSKMYFEGIFNFNLHPIAQKDRFNWQGSLNSYLASSYYELFASFKSSKKLPILVNTASLRFSPLLMYYPRQNNLTPLLSFYIGNFRTPLTFRNLYKVSFSQVSPSSKRRHYPGINNIKLSKARGHLGIGFEIALPFFNFYFFWKNISKYNNIEKLLNPFSKNFSSYSKNEFNLYASFKTDKLMKNKAKLNIALLSSFIQKKDAESNNTNVKIYTQLYAIDFNLTHPIFFFNSLNSISITPKKTVDSHSFGFREEAGFSYKILKLNAGFSYEGAQYASHLEGKKRQIQANSNILNDSVADIFTFYVQEKIKWKIFSASHSYSLIKQTNEKEVKHSYGFFYSIGNRLALFKNELLFFQELYTLKFSFSSHPNTYYFKTFSLSSTLYFQDKHINPHVIKKYEMNSAFLLNFTENFYCKIEASIFQENTREKARMSPRWKTEVFRLKASFFFIFSQERWKEKGVLSFKYSTDKHAVETILKMRFEY